MTFPFFLLNFFTLLKNHFLSIQVKMKLDIPFSKEL